MTATASLSMTTVHVFVSTGRFRSFAEMRAFIDQTCTEDGDGVPSAFMRETGLARCEPGCIEAIFSATGTALPVRELLQEASWASAWADGIAASVTADAAICVFEPNELGTPGNCSMDYVGRFTFEAR